MGPSLASTAFNLLGIVSTSFSGNFRINVFSNFQDDFFQFPMIRFSDLKTSHKCSIGFNGLWEGHLC